MPQIKVDYSELNRLERSLMTLYRNQVPFATARALNDCTRAASLGVNRAMAEVFDRPTAFTSRAAIAPRELAATKASLASTVTLRPVQAKYLERQEGGGIRTPASNTRRPGRAIVLPGAALGLDAHGNMPIGQLRRLRQQVRAAKRARAAKSASGESIAFLEASARGNRAGIGGYFRRAGSRLIRLTAFIPTARYRPRFGYHARVEAIVRATWPGAMARRLAEAVRTAR